MHQIVTRNGILFKKVEIIETKVTYRSSDLTHFEMRLLNSHQTWNILHNPTNPPPYNFFLRK